MKRLIPGMFSSISDMEFIAKTLDVESVDTESDVPMDAEPDDPGLSDVDSNGQPPG
jgi:hypothetical protein